jgi:hypothetical protein
LRHIRSPTTVAVGGGYVVTASGQFAYRLASSSAVPGASRDGRWRRCHPVPVGATSFVPPQAKEIWMSHQTLAQQLSKVLRQAGVERVLGVVGDSLHPVINTIRGTDGIGRCTSAIRGACTCVAAARPILLADGPAAPIGPSIDIMSWTLRARCEPGNGLPSAVAWLG